MPLPSANDVTNPQNVLGTVQSVAWLFTTYLLPFEITSILLLMAIVGAMLLARRENEAEVERIETVAGRRGRCRVLRRGGC